MRHRLVFGNWWIRRYAVRRTPKRRWLKLAHYLGIGISNLVVGFSPEAVVVGGEIARAWPLVESCAHRDD